MSVGLTAKLVPYSSAVGKSITLHVMDGPVIAQLTVMAPVGPPPGEDRKAFVERVAKIVADAINKHS